MDGLEFAARPNASDSERTRLLKQVLQSSSRLQRELRITLGTPAATASRFSPPDSAPTKSKEQLPPDDQLAAASLKDKLQLCAQGHEEICEERGAGAALEMSPVLRSCGERIGTLSGKLFALEDQLILRGGVVARGEEDGSPAIEIVPHGQQASAATRHKAEEAAERALMQHARFKPLEDLQETLQKDPSYEDLRQLFPRRYRWNPNLYLLTDETLKNPQEFKEAVWRKLPKDTDEDLEASNGRNKFHWRRTGSPARKGSKREVMR